MSSLIAPLALTKRQADTVRRLVEAAAGEVARTGYTGLTVRNVARRADMSPATAYTYFASKNHLITEVFWRRLQALPDLAPEAAARPSERAAAVLRDFALLVSGEPELAAACTTAMLGEDPEVRLLRDQIGAELYRRLQAALGDAADAAVIEALLLASTGAMVQAGMGYLSYGEVADRLTGIVDLMVTKR